jgi:thiamine kinase-like enzyme
MIEGVTLDKESSVENRAKYFEEVIEYFRHLGELIMRFGQDKKFVRRQNIHTVLIYFYMLVRSAWMYPRIIPRLAHGLALFLSDLPYLAADRSLAFVHRDLTYMNVLKLSDGRIGVIDFELAVVTNPLYEVTQAVTGSWHLENFCREFYRRRLVKEILADKNKRHCYRALTIFTGVHRLATSPAKEFASHYSYYKHGLGLVRPEPKLSRENTVTAPVADKN